MPRFFFFFGFVFGFVGDDSVGCRSGYAVVVLLLRIRIIMLFLCFFFCAIIIITAVVVFTWIKDSYRLSILLIPVRVISDYIALVTFAAITVRIDCCVYYRHFLYIIFIVIIIIFVIVIVIVIIINDIIREDLPSRPQNIIIV